MKQKREAQSMPGDIRMADRAARYGEQTLSTRQRAVLERGMALFRFFYDRNREAHAEMRQARSTRRLRQDGKSMTAPASTALQSSMDNVIADQMDNMPEALLVPEREETAASAEEMTDIVSYVMYQAGWPGKYGRIMEDATVTGTGIAEVFWDEDADDGEGMVNIMVWHPEDIYPDPMYEDIQEGRAIFKTIHTTVAWVEEHYPEAKGYVRADEYAQQDEQSLIEAPEGDEKVTLIEYWYKRYDRKKNRYRVHMAQMAGGALLYSTETDYGTQRKGEYSEGVYAHGLYPFTFYRYREVYGSPFGTGLVHDYRDTQDAIDRYQKYIDDNARYSSIQRTYVRKNAGINVDDVADLNKTIIEWEGNDIREVMQTTQAAPLNNQVYQMMVYLTDAMKQDSGQNQFARGEGGLGVTAATAIQALQEAGGKITRWHTLQFKDAFRDMTEQILWVLSEYMEPGRRLRIVGGWDSTGNMKDRLVTLIAAGAEGDALPRPAYTVRVQVQRNNPLVLQAQNELLTQAAQVCAQYGEPMPPETFIRLLQGYPNKSSVLRAVAENSRSMQKMQQLGAQVEQLTTQLEQQKRVNQGYAKAMQTQGGGAAMRQAGRAPDYARALPAATEGGEGLDV